MIAIRFCCVRALAVVLVARHARRALGGDAGAEPAADLVVVLAALRIGLRRAEARRSRYMPGRILTARCCSRRRPPAGCAGSGTSSRAAAASARVYRRRSCGSAWRSWACRRPALAALGPVGRDGPLRAVREEGLALRVRGRGRRDQRSGEQTGERPLRDSSHVIEATSRRTRCAGSGFSAASRTAQPPGRS